MRSAALPAPSRFAVWLACALIASGALAADGEGSGVRGTVTLSPACGGAQREGADCKAPYANVDVRLIADSGVVAASSRTSATGRYSLPSPAGHYRLQVMSLTKVTRCPTLDVVVTAHAFSTVDIECDSGMR